VTAFVLTMFILFCVNALFSGVLLAIDVAQEQGDKAVEHLIRLVFTVGLAIWTGILLF